MYKKLSIMLLVLFLFIGTIATIRREVNIEKKEKNLKEKEYRNIAIDKSKKGIFRPTGNMKIKRYGHLAIKLQTGKILVIGGEGSGTSIFNKSINTAEVYDPKNETFTRAGNLRFGESTFFNNNHVFLLSSGKVVLLHSYNIEIYDPAKNKFYPAGHLYQKRNDYAAALMPDERILIVGGRYSYPTANGYGIASKTAEIYNPITKKSSLADEMNIPRFSAKAVTLNNGNVLIVGGQCGKEKQAKAELYNTKTGKFSLAADMLIPRSSFTATLLNNGDVLITGEISQKYKYNNKKRYREYFEDGFYAEIYNPKINKFIKSGKMNNPRNRYAAVLLKNNKVLIIGGNRQGKVSTAELYDPKTNRFKTTGNMHYKVSDLQATLLNNGNVLVTGGINHNYYGPKGRMEDCHKAEIYIPEE